MTVEQATVARMLVVLDAMGVQFRTRDDWPGGLSTFVRSRGGARATDERDAFVELYIECTLGRATGDLWEWCGLDPSGLDEAYLDAYVTTPGLEAFLDAMERDGHVVCCLTNDAAAWSHALRARHRLERISPWVVSSEIGFRKPAHDAFLALERAAGRGLAGAVFVDDTAKNLDAAAALGMRPVHYRGDGSSEHPLATDWLQVIDVVRSAMP